MSGPLGVPGDALCILPWIHLEVVPEGKSVINALGLPYCKLDAPCYVV